MSSLRNSKAFTLIELLVVVGIIALLVSIMVPAVQRAMDTAKDGVVRTQFYAIGVGLEMFKQDNLAGRGQYPTSLYDSPAIPGADNIPGYVSLAIQLVGRDRRGYDAADLYDGSPNEIRREPYIKLETTGIVETSGLPNPGPEEMEPVLLCKWGQPILYFRATPGSTVRDKIVDIYYPTDNLNDLASMLQADQQKYWGVYHTATADKDPLLDSSDQNVISPPGDGGYSYNPTGYGNFYKSMVNPQMGLDGVTSSPSPYNVDSFILISAGKDQRFGTADDIKNFSD